MFRVKSPDKTLQIVHLRHDMGLLSIPTAWKCAVIGSAARRVGLETDAKTKGKLDLITICRFEGILELKPLASGLCCDIKTLSGVAKMTSKPSAYEFDICHAIKLLSTSL
jgi:hypothetical protein